ncbi:MAG TPA: phosphotransferase [Thermoanaerobaculaceae bacterium]|nr:phosphotransferase [Thermoanaerobaculaceae bacterium]
MGPLESGLVALGMVPVTLVELAGDASRRRFFRVSLADGATIVAALYPDALAEAAEHDHRVQVWAWRHGLPVPRPLGKHGVVVASQDVGDQDLDRLMAAEGERAFELALEALAAFQGHGWDDLPNPPFDAAFFRRELAIFEEVALPPAVRGTPEVAGFLDRLASALEGHPYRLVHRDFHVNNLFPSGGKILAVDYQDMRGGPDTYDLASLLRERGGTALADQAGACARAAVRLGWEPGWERRYMECAAQRGLKVVGTFLRLAAGGRPGYLRWLPAVRDHSAEALVALDAPEALRRAVAGLPSGQGL